MLSTPIRRAVVLGLGLGLGLAAAACSKASEEANGKRSPAPPPPTESRVPGDLEIPVTVAGKASAPITSRTLASREPDFADRERRAWRLDAVLGDRLGEGDVVEAVGPGGVAVSLVAGGSRVAVLYLTRRGKLAAAVIDPANPFPDYHGQGGRLRRPGDPLPRVQPVSELRVRRSASPPPSPAAALRALALTVDGEPADLSAEVIAKLDATRPEAGGHSGPAWSLRRLAALVAGKGGRATRVVGKRASADISEAEWGGGAEPVLIANRRGLVKLVWVEDGARRNSVRHVLRVELSR